MLKILKLKIIGTKPFWGLTSGVFADFCYNFAETNFNTITS